MEFTCVYVILFFELRLARGAGERESRYLEVSLSFVIQKWISQTSTLSSHPSTKKMSGRKVSPHLSLSYFSLPHHLAYLPHTLPHLLNGPPYCEEWECGEGVGKQRLIFTHPPGPGTKGPIRWSILPRRVVMTVGVTSPEPYFVRRLTIALIIYWEDAG